MQTPVQFRNSSKKILRGVIHRPDYPAGRRGVPGVILFNGFTGNRIESHRLFVKCARALACHGFASLRFDFYGSGESDGDFSEATLETEIADATCAVDFFRRQRGVNPGRLGLIGLSLGGAIASAIAYRVRAQALVLWSAVARLFELRELTERLAQAVCPTGTAAYLDYNGHAVSPRFFEKTDEADPLRQIALFRQPTLVVHAERDSVVAVSHAEDYMRVAGARVKEKIIIAGADHTFSSLAWEREVIDRTVAWLQLRLKGLKG